MHLGSYKYPMFLWKSFKYWKKINKINKTCNKNESKTYNFINWTDQLNTYSDFLLSSPEWRMKFLFVTSEI